MPCKICHSNATTYGSCPYGSSRDNINCTCNAGFYGNGTACAPCKTCDAHALQIGSCPGGSSSDGISCSCNGGYHGSGTSCTQCAMGSYSHQGWHCAQNQPVPIISSFLGVVKMSVIWTKVHIQKGTCAQPIYHILLDRRFQSAMYLCFGTSCRSSKLHLLQEVSPKCDDLRRLLCWKHK